MKPIGDIYSVPERPIRIAQFGEGNFLRAFVDWMVDIANESGAFAGNIAVIKPRPGHGLEVFHRQGNVYTVQLRGIEGGKPCCLSRVIRSVASVIDPHEDEAAFFDIARGEELRFVVSNTTEAGIEFRGDDPLPERGMSKTFPGKLTQLLYARYLHFGGKGHGLIMLPAELNDRNGDMLRECVFKYCRAWALGDEFARWLEDECVFACTLVDRIVTGYPRDEIADIEGELGYTDALLTTGEPFALWVIESGRDISAELPLDKAGLPVIFTRDIRPYKERKVRLLNGAHTCGVAAAYLAGCDTVLDMMQDEVAGRFVREAMLSEMAPCVPLPIEEARAFAGDVIERFMNPYVRHNLLSISLNSFAKWRARELNTLRDNIARGHFPRRIAFSLAALLAFYTGEDCEGGYMGRRGDERYAIQDDVRVIATVRDACRLPAREYAHAILKRDDFWGEDMTAIPGLEDAVADGLNALRTHGMREALRMIEA